VKGELWEEGEEGNGVSNEGEKVGMGMKGRNRKGRN